MKFLTDNQKKWIVKRNVKAGYDYPFPPWGFTAYETPEYGKGIRFDTDPFFRSLSHESFYVQSIEGDFCKGVFKGYSKRLPAFYILKSELEAHSLTEIIVHFIIGFVPMTIYNFYHLIKYEIQRRYIQ